MIPPQAKTKFTRQPHEKVRDRKTLLAGIIVGLTLAAAVGYVIYAYGTKLTG